MNTINSIFPRRNLGIIEVIINIRAASRAINFRTRSLRAQTCHELGSVPSLIISSIRDEAPEVPTSSFNFLPEDSNKNARRLRRQTRMAGCSSGAGPLVIQPTPPNVIPLSEQRGRWNVSRMRYRDSMCSRSHRTHWEKCKKYLNQNSVNVVTYFLIAIGFTLHETCNYCICISFVIHECSFPMSINHIFHRIL